MWALKVLALRLRDLKSWASALAFLVASTSGAVAQSFKEIDVRSVPEVAQQLANPKLLYPLGGLNRDQALGFDQAYYTQVTTRYGHDIFRTSNEYTTLAVEVGAQVYRVTLDSDVFEDTYPLIADLNGDGAAEIITTQSSQTEGGSLAIYAIRDGGLRKVTQTPNIGTRNRWMNVAGIADFNGDGLIEIALVDRPHIRGELEFWTYTANETLELRTASLGFSNHFIGSNAQRLSHVVERDGKPPLLALPSTSRSEMLLVDASGREIDIVASAALGSPVAENFASASVDGSSVIGVLLANGDKRAFKIID